MAANWEDSIDAELRPYLESAPRIIRKGDTLEVIQDRLRALNAERVPAETVPNNSLRVTDKVIVADGHEVNVRIYQPLAQSPEQGMSALLWIHGGGFIAGDLDSQDLFCREIAEELTCIIVSVDYRLAPQAPYPAAQDDCFAALCWIAGADNALEVDPTKISVGGVSAGACLAAGVVIRARDLGGPAINFQMLLIPVLDDRHQTPSSHCVTDSRVWCRALSQKAWAGYLQDIDGDVPTYAAPARLGNFKGLPPTLISVEGEDLLRDEGIDFAQNLMKAGIAVELHVFPGCFHGSFLGIPDANVSKRHLMAIKQALDHILNNNPICEQD